MYLENRNHYLNRGTSPTEAYHFIEAEPKGPIPGVLTQGLRKRAIYERLHNVRNLATKAIRSSIPATEFGTVAVFGLLVIGLLGPALSVGAQTSADVKSVSCSAVMLVSPSTVSCSVALSAPAPAGGFPVQLTSSSPALSVPASVVVGAGQSSAVFSATGSPIATAESATVTAGTGTGQLGTTVSLVSSTSPLQVIAKSSGKCLDVRDFSRAKGGDIQQWSCTDNDNQQWLFTATDDGSYEVASVNSGMSLTVEKNSSSKGAAILQWIYVGAASQKWRLRPMGDGYYTLVVESTGKCLDVRGGPPATGEGVPVQQWDCWGGDNQAWQLVSKHNVSLSWDPSTSPHVAGYYVYRGTRSGGPYTKLSSLLTGTSYVDGTVKAGQTYYYVTIAADSSGDESAYSNQVRAAIPSS